MADSKLTVGELVYKISGDMDNLKTELKKSEAEIKKLQSSMESTSRAANKTQSAMNGFGTALKYVGGLIAVSTITSFFKSSLEAANAQIVANSKLANTLSNVRGARDEDYQALLNQAAALQRVTTFADEQITNSQAMLATFQLTGTAIGELTPRLLDMAQATAGLSGGTIDLQGATIAIGKAMTSGIGVLSRYGVTFTDAQKKAFELGNETQKLSVLTEVLDANFKGTAETVGKTFQGRMIQLKNAFGDVKEQVGAALIPTLEVLVGSLAKGVDGANANSNAFTTFGRTVYKIAQGLVIAAKVFKFFISVLVATADTLISTAKVGFNFAKDIVHNFTNMGKVMSNVFGALKKGLSGDFDGALEALKHTAADAFSNTTASMQQMANYSEGWSQELGGQIDSFGESLNDFRHGFKAATLDAVKGYQAMGGAATDFGGGTDKASKAADELTKKIEALQKRLLDLISASQKTTAELEGNLTKTFEKFSGDLNTNFGDTVTSLAQIVITAEDTIKELRTELADSEKDFRKSMSEAKDSKQASDIFDRFSKQKKELLEQIAEQERVLAAREEFEQRQFDRVASIQAKLTQAGINSAEAGLDSVLRVDTLQNQIDEERRRQSLDEFTRFEEDQARKLVLLTDALITEATLLKEKIEKQKGYEADLTSYLLSEDSKRLENTDAWAMATIGKYQEVADSLKNLLSAQAQITNTQVGSPNPLNTPSLQNTGNGGQTTNSSVSTTVNAPVTINGQSVNNMTPQEISAILGFELNKYIR